MSDIPIIGQQEQTFSLCFHVDSIKRIDSYEKSIRWLMIAVYPADLDGKINCYPAVIGMWDDITQKATMQGSSFKLTRDRLVNANELKLDISFNPPAPIEENLTKNEILFADNQNIS